MYCSQNSVLSLFFFFFFNDTATTEIYTLSLHDALPICGEFFSPADVVPEIIIPTKIKKILVIVFAQLIYGGRSEEHTSELQSRPHLVCRLLLEKKKKNNTHAISCA